VVGADKTRGVRRTGPVISTRRGTLAWMLAFLRIARRTPERLLHPWRRARARGRLAAGAAPSTVLVVCHGNICRSPYAAGALRRLVPPPVRVESAGLVGPHRSAPPEAVDVAGERGIDLRRHSSRLASPAAIAKADLVIVMEPGQAASLRSIGRPKRPILALGDLDPAPVTHRTIRDPVEQPRHVFAESYDRIDRCLAELVNTIWGRRSG